MPRTDPSNVESAVAPVVTSVAPAASSAATSAHSAPAAHAKPLPPPSLALLGDKERELRLQLRLALLRGRIETSYVHVHTVTVIHEAMAEAVSDATSDATSVAPVGAAVGAAAGAAAGEAAGVGAPFESFAVHRSTCAAWEGERVVVWRRGLTSFWAVQEACPHAAISLAMSDIEDLSDAFEGSTHGPCISCPAHAYIFDLGSGACLTHPRTKDARRYRIGLWRVRGKASEWQVGGYKSEEGGEGGGGEEGGGEGGGSEGGGGGGSEADGSSGNSEVILVWLSKEPMPPEVRESHQVDKATGHAIQMEMVRRGLEAKYGPS